MPRERSQTKPLVVRDDSALRFAIGTTTREKQHPAGTLGVGSGWRPASDAPAEPVGSATLAAQMFGRPNTLRWGISQAGTVVARKLRAALARGFGPLAGQGAGWQFGRVEFFLGHRFDADGFPADVIGGALGGGSGPPQQVGILAQRRHPVLDLAGRGPLG